MVSLGLILTGLAAVAGLIVVSRFGEPFGAGAAGIGSGLTSFGQGIRSFVSQVSSPTVRPIIDFSQVLPGLQAGLGAAGQAIQTGVIPDKQDAPDDQVMGGGGAEIGQFGAGALPPEYLADEQFF